MPWPKGRPYSAEHIAKRTRKLSENGLRHKKPVSIGGVDLWVCPMCKNALNKSDYHSDKRTANGLKSHCKTCHQKVAVATRNQDTYRATKRLTECRRRARKAGAAIGRYGKADIAMLSQLLGDACLACGSTVSVQIDHIVPLAKGGADHPINFQPLCRKCNERKQARERDYRTESQRSAVAAFWVVEFQPIS